MAAPLPTSQNPTRSAIDPDTDVGAVSLTVSDLDRSRAFYERALGLRARELDDGAARAGRRRRRAHSSSCTATGVRRPRDHRATGLFHLAILVPDAARPRGRAHAAGARRAGRSTAPRTTSSARRCTCPIPTATGSRSTATVLATSGARNGDQLQMATLPLDLDDLLGELADGVEQAQPDAPRRDPIGHVHLQVSELDAAEAFYSGVLGFDVMVRGYPGALFVSAGGYHHHIGLNTWHSAGAAPPPPGAVGLRTLRGRAAGRTRTLSAVLERAARRRHRDRPSGERHARPRSVGQRHRARASR